MAIKQPTSRIITLVEKWSNSFKLPVKTVPTHPDTSETSFAYKLIEEELNELHDNIFINGTGVVDEGFDMEAVADDIGDILWTTIRFAQTHGLNLDRIIEEIYISNMSKACTTIDQVERTMMNYRLLGIDSYYETIDNEGSLIENNYYIVRRKSDGKILKNVEWKEPDFSKVINNTTQK